MKKSRFDVEGDKSKDNEQIDEKLSNETSHSDQANEASDSNNSNDFENQNNSSEEGKNKASSSQNTRSFFASLSKFFTVVVDIILYPLIMLSIITSVVSVTARDNKEIKSLFGYSIVTVLTGSMIDGGFDIGDVVFLKTAQPEKLRPKITKTVLKENQEGEEIEVEEVVSAGDVVAFYKYMKDVPSTTSLRKIENFDEVPEPITDQSLFPENIKQQAIAAGIEVVFHRIVAVYIADDGTYFFETKGDNNNSTDGLINENLLVGKYVKAAAPITNALTYMITPSGMFWVIIIPLAVIVFLQIIELMTIIFDMATEKKVLEGTLPFDSEESIKAKIGRDMSDHNKIYFYDITPLEDKERVKSFLWEEANDKAKTKKEIQDLEKVEESLKIYEKDREAFWDFWMEETKSKSKLNKLKKLRRNATIIVKAKKLNKM